MKLIYSPESVQDLIRLREFIAQNNPSTANRIATELVTRIEKLRLFPEIGRLIDQPQVKSQSSIRDFSFGNYIVRYISHMNSLTILRIWHHYESRE